MELPSQLLEIGLEHIDQRLTCPICLSHFQRAMVLPRCGHNYCEKCICECLKTRSECPLCRMRTEKKDIISNRIVDDLVTSFESFIRIISHDPNPEENSAVGCQRMKQCDKPESHPNPIDVSRHNSSPRRQSPRDSGSCLIGSLASLTTADIQDVSPISPLIMVETPWTDAQESQTHEPVHPIMDIETRRKYEKRKIMEIDRTSLRQGECWYLIEAQWLRKWNSFAMEGSASPLPGPIENHLLMARNGQPKPNLLKAKHYRGVVQEVWDFFVEHYTGGPEIRRQFLDIYSDPM